MNPPQENRSMPTPSKTEMIVILALFAIAAAGAWLLYEPEIQLTLEMFRDTLSGDG